MQRIMNTVQKYMPYVELQGFDSQAEYAQSIGLGNIKIVVEYTIPRANIGATKLEIIFSIS